MSAAGWVITAGGIAAANEILFAPVSSGKAVSFNWRIIPATAILALVLTGFEKVAPEFGNILGGMILLTVLTVQVGNAPSPLANIAKVVA
jgi:hypothetical protein